MTGGSWQGWGSEHPIKGLSPPPPYVAAKHLAAQALPVIARPPLPLEVTAEAQWVCWAGEGRRGVGWSGQLGGS